MKWKVLAALLLCACAKKQQRAPDRVPLRVTIDDFGADALGEAPRVRVVRDASVTLRGSVSESPESVMCNNAPATIMGRRWRCTMTIIDTGQGMGINVIAKSRDGKGGYATVGVLIDRDAPSVKITSVKRQGDSLLVEGDCGDNFPIGVTVTVNGVNAPIHDWRFSVSVPAASGVTAVVRDAVGNTASAERALQ